MLIIDRHSYASFSLSFRSCLVPALAYAAILTV